MVFKLCDLKNETSGGEYWHVKGGMSEAWNTAHSWLPTPSTRKVLLSAILSSLKYFIFKKLLRLKKQVWNQLI